MEKPRTIDGKILLLLVLAVLAAILTYVRETEFRPASQIGEVVFSKDHVAALADSVLRSQGIDGKKIRHRRTPMVTGQSNREEVRVDAPAGFETSRLLLVLNDSLARYGVKVIATENLKEKTSSIHFLYDKNIFETIVISYAKKGVPSSVNRKRTGGRR